MRLVFQMLLVLIFVSEKPDFLNVATAALFLIKKRKKA